MRDFSTAEPQRDFDVLPAGTLAFAILTIRPDKATGEIETQNDKGNKYLNAQVQICEGPFNRRVIFKNINTENTNATARDIGASEIRSILEVGRNACAANMAGYCIENYGELSGLKVAVEVTVEPAKNGYPEKNGVRFLTPNEDSGTSKKFKRLLSMAQAGYPKEVQSTPQGQTSAPTWVTLPTQVSNAGAPPPLTTNTQTPATNKPAWL